MTFKEGDRIRANLVGNDYPVMGLEDRVVLLESEDKSYQLLTMVDHLRLIAPAKKIGSAKK